MASRIRKMPAQSKTEFRPPPDFLRPDENNIMFLEDLLTTHFKRHKKRALNKQDLSQHSGACASSAPTYRNPNSNSRGTQQQTQQHHHDGRQIDSTDSTDSAMGNNDSLPSASQINTTPSHGTRNTGGNGHRHKKPRKPRTQRACTECRDRKLKCYREKPSCSSESRDPFFFGLETCHADTVMKRA